MIATQAAGSRQQSRFLALMSDYERTLELVETAQDSAGRSSQQFAKYADSVEYSVKRLSNTWEQFRVNLLSSDLYKGFIDNINTLLEKISDFNVWDWTKLLTVFFTVGQSSVKSFLSGAQQAFSNITPALQKGMISKLPDKFSETSVAQRFILGAPSQKRIDKDTEAEYNRQNIEYGKQSENFITAQKKAYDEQVKLQRQISEVTGQKKDLTEIEQRYVYDLKEELKVQKDIQKEAKESYENLQKPSKEAVRESEALKLMKDPATSAAQFQAIGAAAGAAFTAAFTTSMMTDDPGKVFTSTLLGGATAAIPGIVNIFSAEFSATGDIGSAIGASLKGGLKAAAVVLIIAGIATAIKAGTKALNEHNEKVLETESGYYRATKKLEKLKEEEERLGNEAYKTASQAEKTSKAYEDLASKTKELEELRNKVLLTSDETARLTEVSNEIAKIAPELVAAYDVEGNAVITLKDSYSELLEVKKQNMLQDQLVSDEANQKYTKNAMEQAFVSRKRAQELYNLVQNPTDILGKTLQFISIQSSAGLPIKLAKELANSWVRESGQLGLPEIGLNSTDLKQFGALFKEISVSFEDFEFLQEVEDEDVLSKLLAALQKSPDLVESYNKVLEEVNNDYTSLDQEIKNAINNYVQSSKNKVTTELQLNSDLYNAQTDKSVQNFMIDYVLQSAGLLNVTEEELRKRFKEYLQTQPLILEDEDDYEDAYQDWISNLFENIEINTDNLGDTFTAAIISIISQLGNLKLDLPQLAEYILKSTGGDENNPIFQTWLGQNATRIAAYNKKVEEAAEVVGATVRSGTGDILTASDARVSNILSEQNAGNFVEKLNTWAEAGRVNEFFNILSGLSSEQQRKLFEQDWSAIASSEYEAYINTLAKEWEHAPEDIENIVKKINLYDIIPANTDALKDDVKERIEIYDKYDKKIKAMQTAGDSWAKNGKVSASGIESLYNAGFDVFKLINKDLQFNAAEAKNIIEEEINGELRFNELQKNAIEDEKNKMELMLQKTKEYKLEELAAFSPEDIKAYFIKGTDGLYTLNKTAAEARRDTLQEESNQYSEIIAALEYLLKTLLLENQSVFKGIEKSAEESAEKIADAQKAVDEAYENILEKQQAVIDAQEKLNETLYGTDTHKNKLDILYNYNTALETLEDRIKDAKDALDNLDGRDPAEFLAAWLTGTREKAINLQATNNRYNAAIGSIESMLNGRLVNYLQGLGRGISTNVADYYSYNSNLDRYEINYNQLNLASMNDDLKDFIEEQVDLMNQYKKNVKKNQDDLKELEKEFKEYQKKIRDDYISVQESVAKTLEEFYKKEVEDKKEMYEALEEADNKYLDALEKAIDKERKLRDKQDKWSSLSTKEKKLSLLQRDTSGANQKQVQSLQKEIEKDRQSMLDNAVDDVVNSLKELYETQKETRDIELQYQETLLENSNYIAEANSLLQSWKTVDDMRNWMWEHTTDMDKMSDQAVEKLTEDWAEMFDTIQTYNTLTTQEFSTTFDISAQEVQNVVIATSEVLTSEANRALNEISTDVTKAIEDAEKAVSDAMEALADAQNTYNEKLKEFNELVADYIELTTGERLNTSNQKTFSEMANLVAWAKENPIQNNEDNADNKKGGISDLVRNTKAISLINNKYPGLIELLQQDRPAHGKFTTDEIEAFKDLGFIVLKQNNSTDWVVSNAGYSDFIKQDPMHRSQWYQYKKGGLASYTGPAWVDGTPTRPEAFLNADDTARIGEAADIFASIASLGANGSLISGLSQSIGDTNVQLNIHVDSIATPEQVDYLIDRVKEEFVDAANPIGAAVILHQ